MQKVLSKSAAMLRYVKLTGAGDDGAGDELVNDAVDGDGRPQLVRVEHLHRLCVVSEVRRDVDADTDGHQVQHVHLQRGERRSHQVRVELTEDDQNSHVLHVGAISTGSLAVRSGRGRARENLPRPNREGVDQTLRGELARVDGRLEANVVEFVQHSVSARESELVRVELHAEFAADRVRGREGDVGEARVRVGHLPNDVGQEHLHHILLRYAGLRQLGQEQNVVSAVRL